MQLNRADIEIRPFVLRDLEAVHSIERRSFPRPWPKLAFQVLHRRNPGGFHVAISEGSVVGYAIATIERGLKVTLDMKKRGHLVNLAVDQGFRRRGIGKALALSIIAHLEAEGVDDAYLEVRASNMAARKLYSGLGFKEARIIKRYYIDEDGVVMVKEF